MHVAKLRENIRFIIIILVVIIVSVGGTWYFLSKQSALPQDDLGAVKTSVGKLMLLPEGEEPTLAIVRNKSELKDKFLKSNAENGDQVLIYTNLGQAIIYRPSANKIVAVTPVTVDAAQAQADGAKITVLNGTNDPTILDEFKDTLTNKYPNATIKTGNANRRDFPTTIVIDNNDTKDDLFVQVLDLINGRRGEVPIGEAKADADVLVIIGKNTVKGRAL